MQPAIGGRLFVGWSFSEEGQAESLRSGQVAAVAPEGTETTVRAVDKELENRGQPGCRRTFRRTWSQPWRPPWRSLTSSEVGSGYLCVSLPPEESRPSECSVRGEGSREEKKELKAAILALHEAEVNVKVEELEIALVEAGGVDSEAGDVDPRLATARLWNSRRWRSLRGLLFQQPR